MSRQTERRSLRARASSSLMTLRRRVWRSWSSWRLRRATRRLAKREQHLLLLRLETDRALLMLKEAEQQVAMLSHRLQETAESELFRRTGQLPE